MLEEHRVMTRRVRLMPTLVFAACLAMFLAAGTQRARSQQRGRGGQPPPRPAWSEDQIREAMTVARVGRRLTPKRWPNGAKVAVSIGYDLDNIGIGRGGPLPAAASSGEYGAVEGLPRILALLDRQQLPATFFLPVSSAVLNPEMTGLIQRSGRHEIALHGWVHENQNAVNDPDEELRLLTQELDYFQRVLGKRPVGSRAPAWNFSPNSVDALRKAGLLYDSSMMGLDEPYEIEAKGRPSGLVELPVEWILDDAPYFGANGALPVPELIFKTYRDEFDVAYKEGTLVMLTFHPHISGHRSRIVQMEQLFEYIKAKPGVWFGTAEQVARFVKQNAGMTH
jgi:peptidoglycan/xylan/chitin deacetylase (PgdA/CDA1 family)